MKKIIPYGKHSIFKSDILAISKVLKSNFLTTGPIINKFENAFKKYTRVKYAIACSSGTAAIHLALESIEIKKNDNIIIPAINFIAAVNLSSKLGANIFLADVDKFTGQMTPKNLIKCIEHNKLKKVKAFFTMYNGGNPDYLKEFYKIKKKYSSFFIEDACHALGAKYSIKDNLKVGNCKYSDIATFSFHPVKSITTGEGGMVTTNSKYLSEKVKLLRNHGIRRKKSTKKKYSWSYKIEKQGFNYRLSDINCALGLSQLNKLDQFIRIRNKIAKHYDKNFSNFNDFIYTPKHNKNILSAWHLYIVIINFEKLKVNKEYIIQQLYKNRIVTQVHYIPTFYHDIYKNLRKNFLKGAIKYYNSCLSLPIHPNLSMREINYISEKIKTLIKRNKKIK